MNEYPLIVALMAPLKNPEKVNENIEMVEKVVVMASKIIRGLIREGSRCKYET